MQNYMNSSQFLNQKEIIGIVESARQHPLLLAMLAQLDLAKINRTIRIPLYLLA